MLLLSIFLHFSQPCAVTPATYPMSRGTPTRAAGDFANRPCEIQVLNSHPGNCHGYGSPGEIQQDGQSRELQRDTCATRVAPGSLAIVFADSGVEGHARIRRDGTGRINPVQGFLVHEQQRASAWHSGCTDPSRYQARPISILSKEDSQGHGWPIIAIPCLVALGFFVAAGRVQE